MTGRRSGHRGLAGAAALALAGLVLAVSLLAGGCGMMDQYKTEWMNTMSEFEARVAKDDSSANALSGKNDLSGLLDLIARRSRYVDSIYDRIVVLRPATAQQKDLHAATLFYLTSVKDQLKANSDYYEAVRAGKPTTDLKTIAEDAAKQTQSMKAVLVLDMERAGAKIKKTQPKNSKPGSSVPVTLPN